MIALRKRWDGRRLIGGVYDKPTTGWRWFLQTTGPSEIWNVACIESSSNGGKPYTLEIWDNSTGLWEVPITFHSLRKAKSVGRLLAGSALAKNF